MITDNTRCLPTPSFFAISEIDPLNRLKTKNRLKKSKKTKTSIFFETQFYCVFIRSPTSFATEVYGFFPQSSNCEITDCFTSCLRSSFTPMLPALSVNVSQFCKIWPLFYCNFSSILPNFKHFSDFSGYSVFFDFSGYSVFCGFLFKEKLVESVFKKIGFSLSIHRPTLPCIIMPNFNKLAKNYFKYFCCLD